MIEQHLRDWLISDSTIAADVGTRVYPQFVPENAEIPAIAYSMVSDQATMAMNGPAANRDPRIQLSIIAASQAKVGEIAEKVKKRVNVWNATYSDMVVSSSFAEGGVYLSLDYYTPPRFGMIVECFLHWQPVP
jgi:hypothetical protein